MAGPKDDGYNKWKEDMNDREHAPYFNQVYMKVGAVKRLCGPSYDGVPDVDCQPKREFKVYTTDYSKCEASACMHTYTRWDLRSSNVVKKIKNEFTRLCSYR